MQLSNVEFMAKAIVELGSVESDTIEYKKSDKWKDKILKTACAYANNYMMREIGFIFIGVEEANEDDGTKAIPVRPITGIDEGKLESCENRLRSLLSEIHPRIEYHLLDIVVDDRHCVVVAVEPGTAGPYETSERAQSNKAIGLKAGSYIRVGRETRLPNRREELALLKKFAGVHFSSELNSSATVDDLNYEWMREYLVRTNASEDTRRLSKLDMAEAMGLVSGSEYGRPRAKNFAVLMFCDRPQDFIPYARVEIIREAKGTDRMVATVFDGPIWIQVERAIDFFQEVIMATYTVREDGSATHRMVANWPERAFRELLINAVVHKDYDKPEYVGVYVYEDEIDIINHNLPLPPVTIGALNDERRFPDRRYLNPELKEMFFALNLIESYGSGIRRAKDAMLANGSPPLSFKPTDEENDYTMVTMPINEEFASMRDSEAGIGATSRGTDKETAATGKETDKETAATGKETDKETAATGKETDKETAATDKETDKETAATDKETDDTDKEICDTGKETNNIRDRIVLMLTQDPGLTLRDMAERLGLSMSGVRYHMGILRRNHIVYREGSTKSGRWIVVDKEKEDAEG